MLKAYKKMHKYGFLYNSLSIDSVLIRGSSQIQLVELKCLTQFNEKSKVNGKIVRSHILPCQKEELVGNIVNASIEVLEF